MLLVGLAPRTARSVAALGERLGFEPRTYATAEAALQDDDATLLVTALGLPGLSGVELAMQWHRPGRHAVVLDVIPPALPPTARFGLDGAIVIRAGWCTVLGKWMVACFDPDLSDRRSALVLQPLTDADAIGHLLSERRFDGEEIPFALRVLASDAPPDTIVAVLERVLASNDDDAIAALVLDVAIEQGRAGLGVVEKLATNPAVSPSLRGRSMRHLGGHLEPHLALGLFAECLTSTDAHVRLEAAHAALDCASEHGLYDVLESLARSHVVDAGVRAQAIDRIVRDAPSDEASRIVARRVTDEEPRVARAASAALVRLDGIDADTLDASAATGPFERRRAAMIEIAESVPWRRAQWSLERLQDDPDPRIRGVAYELAIAVGREGFEGSVDRALADDAARVALLGALKSGRPGALSRLATTPSPEQVAAIRALGLRFREAALPTLAPLLLGDDLDVAEAAALATLHANTAGAITLRGAAAHAPRSEIRARLLDLLDAHGAPDVVRDAIARGRRDDDLEVRAAATQIAVRRAGAECAALLDRIAADEEALQDAALDGAIALGLAGFGVAGAIAYDARFALSVRHRAVRWIERTFEPEDSTALFAALEAAWPGITGRALRETTGPARPAGAAELSPTFWTDITAPEEPARREAAPKVYVDPTNPRPTRTNGSKGTDGSAAEAARSGHHDDVRAAAPRRPRRREADPADAFERADTRPAPATHDQRAQSARGVRAGEPTSSRPAPSDAEHSPGDAHGLRDAQERDPLVAQERGRRGAHESSPIAPSVASLLRATPKRHRPALGLERARAALQVALRAGSNGYRGLMTLAASDRVPLEVRVQALRHLASAPSGHVEVADFLVRAMRSTEAVLQEEALRAAVVRGDADLASLVFVVEHGASADTRARATRYLGSRWPVRDVRAVLEARLFDDDEHVRRAALFAIFSSTRFVAEDRREEALVNLLSEHAEPEVRASAALALGAFGGNAAVGALRKAIGGRDEVVRAAAVKALARLGG